MLLEILVKARYRYDAPNADAKEDAMFAYSDPTGTGFLKQSSALEAYRREFGQLDTQFHRVPGSAYARRDAFTQLAPGTQSGSDTVEWKAFPISQSGTPAEKDRNRFTKQDEYVEWRVEADGQSLKRVTFVTEFPEYFEALAEVSAAALKEEIRNLHPGANPTDQEIFGAGFNAATAAPEARVGAFRSNRRNNPWNNGEKGILCLTQRDNTLGALFNLLAACGVPRQGDAGQVCATVGNACGASRNSDPAVCLAAQTLARGNRSFSLEDPGGVRVLGLDPAGQWTVDGEDVDMNDAANNRGIWKVTRNGRRGTFTFHGDVRLAGERITTGTDLSRQLIVGATVIHAPSAALPDWARIGNEQLRIT
jgi:hypothetical protein